jgi:hypothetical protein
MSLNPEQIEKLVRVVAGQDMFRVMLGAVIAACLETVPDIPLEILQKITVTPGNVSDLQTNAPMVIAAWLRKKETADAPSL